MLDLLYLTIGYLIILTLSLDGANLPDLMLGVLKVKSEQASKASVAYVDNPRFLVAIPF